MKRGGLIGLIFAAVVMSLPYCGEGQDRDVAGEFKSAKAGLTSQLKDRKQENRLAAVAKLGIYPTPDAAKLLLFQGLGSADEELKRASFDVLAKMTNDAEVCAYLKTTIGKQWKQGKPQPETYACIALLLASELPDVQEDVLGLVREMADFPAGRNILITLADELANCRGDASARSLVRLMEVPLFEQDFAFRRAIEQALTDVRSKIAVKALIKLLLKARGEVRADIVKYLTNLSGQQLGFEATAWQVWWQENESKFAFPPERKLQRVAANGNVPAQPRPKEIGPSYYGLPLSGAKIIFIIDTSSSMNGPRIVAAKRELCRAIEELPATVEFNVIAFNSLTFAWQGKLVPASPDSKQSAIYFVMAQVLASRTASYDALEAALQYDGEVIYFLTDGAPVGGKITRPTDIIQAVNRLNQFRRMTINSLGIGVGQPGNNFDNFLSTLAEQNFGVYERVDQ
jgi:hypothetical protein